MRHLKHTRPWITGIIVLSLLTPGTAISTQLENQPGNNGLNGLENLAPMVVTARGRESLISQTPGGLGIVDQGEISTINPVSLTNATSRIPGVDKSSDSAWGSAINIRGLGRNSVVFLVDGCRVNTATDINAQFGTVNPLDIQQIEVLKGPITALHGSGSLGGVVNVITRKGRFTPSPVWEGDITTGFAANPKGFDTHGRAAYNSRDFWISTSAGFRDHNSYDAGNDKEIHNSQYRDTSFNTALGARVNPVNTTQVLVQHVKGEEIGIPGKGLSLPTGPDVTYPGTSRTLVNLTHTLTPDSPLISESRINLFYQKIERRVRLDHFPGGPVTEVRPQADHETWGLKWQTIFQRQKHRIVAGVDLWNWEISNSLRYKEFANGLGGVDASLGNVEQFSGGVFAEDEWRLSNAISLNLGGRMDTIQAESDDLYNWITPPSPTLPVALKQEAREYSDTSWNAHAGITWGFMPDWTMTFITASSYRTPDSMDRFKYINLGGGIELFGNPDLTPERSLFFEYGFHYTAPVLTFSASAYLNCLDDLITETRVTSTEHRMMNVDEARIYGGEIEAEYFFTPRLSALGYVAYTHGDNTKLDEPLPFIAPLNGLLGIRYDTTTGFWTRLELEWAADQSRPPQGTLESDGWDRLNFRMGYRYSLWGKHQELMFGMDNVFDQAITNHLSTSRGMALKEPGINYLCVWKIKL
ncbi:MAG: TonB-dependent receptor [Desulfobacterium sp.]|nr:TonB-dependent receptor [Desulfobacterium sp.]